MLVVEDDFFILMELESVLADAGAEVVGLCRGVSDALAVECENDIKRRCSTCVSARRRWSRWPASWRHGTPFVFYTGQLASDPELSEWPLCRVVQKPAQPCTLVNAVIDLLKGRRQSKYLSSAHP